MGRELKRVPLDFASPLNKPYAGYINPHYAAENCTSCDGSGSSPMAKLLKDLWYGYVPFRPEDRGSTPFLPTDAPVMAFATRNLENAPDFYGTGQHALMREAERLATLWNGCWSHHLNLDDVAALIEAGRLNDFTHTWTREGGWQPKSPPYVPTPREVNVWSISGAGHDSINQWTCVGAECKRLKYPTHCSHCEGRGVFWPSAEAERAYDGWEPTEPPEGPGYQIWETVSEGSPISPVFETAIDLARFMATTRWGADQGTSVETWLRFIEGPGWAPSMIGTNEGFVDGVNGVVRMNAAPASEGRAP